MKGIRVMLYPVIDIGSNTVKLSVLDSEHLFSSAPVFFKAKPLGLRARIHDGLLDAGALSELNDLLIEYASIAARLTPQIPIVFATASLRALADQTVILDEIKIKTGLSVEIISGETEAYYSFLGARARHAFSSGCVVDLGGGSTELTAFRGNSVLTSVSLPFGCLTLYNQFFQNGEKNDLACRALIRRHLLESAPQGHVKHLLLSGGSAKAILKYKKFLTNQKNSTVTTDQMKAVLLHFDSAPDREREKIRLVLKDRFPLVPPAVCVFSEIASLYGREKLSVSKFGVREGCLAHFLKNSKKLK